MLEARAYPGQWIAHERQLLPFGKRSGHVIHRDFHRRVAAARQFPSQFPVEKPCHAIELDMEKAGKLTRGGDTPLENPVNYVSRTFAQGKKQTHVRDPMTRKPASIKHRF